MAIGSQYWTRVHGCDTLHTELVVWKRFTQLAKFLSFLFLTLLLDFHECASALSVCKEHKTVFSAALQGTIDDGPEGYQSDQRCEWLISSPDPDKYPFITLEFLSRVTECAYDYIYIFDGDSYDSSVLATLSGSSAIQNLFYGYGGPATQDPHYKVVAQSGKMLVYLFSDKNTEFAGFNATFSINECPNNCTGNGYCLDHKCHCYTGWTGSDCSHHPCPHSCGGWTHGHCKTESELKKCKCNIGYIGEGCQLKVNSSEREGYWTVVDNYQDGPGNFGRAGHAAVFANSAYYIFGGFVLNSAVAELQRFDFEANEWNFLHSSTQPSARYFHSMTAVQDQNNSTQFLLYGGELGDGHLSNETWMYDTSRNLWHMHASPTTNHSVPALCQHTATLVQLNGDQFVYIFGGRTRDSPEFGLSSDMYSFEWTEQRWKKVVYDPSGVKYTKLRVAGHSMVYDEIAKTLVLFGGFQMNSLHKVVSSNSVFLYSIMDNRWAEVVASKEPEPFSYSIEPRAFHSANLVGDFMVVHGGRLRNSIHVGSVDNHNLCYSRQTHFYNLRSHAWIKELHESAEPAPFGVFSHTTAVLNDSVLLLHGGYTGVISRQFLALKLPKLMAVDSAEVANEKCANYEDEVACTMDYLYGCVWAEHACKSGINELSVYGSVCEHLKDCLSCTTFSGYIRNSSYGWNSSHCGWCVQDSTCYPVFNGVKFGACESTGDIYKHDPWWDVNDIKLLKDSERCLMENIQPGVTAEEFHHFPNFSQPDNLLFLTRVYMDLKEDDLFGDYLVRIRGFLRPNNFRGSYLRMLLLSVKGKSQISLSTSDLPKDLKVILNSSKDSDFNITVQSELINLTSFQDDRYFIDISFTHSDTGHWNGKLQVELAISDGEVLNEFSTLSTAHLEQYQSSLIEDSAQIQPCDTLTNCLACLADRSCAWCDSHSRCMSKSTLAAGLITCGQQETLVDFPHVGVITEPASCIVCQDYSTCDECVTSNSHCEWRGNEDAKVRCVRRNSAGKNTTTKPDHCPTPCHHRTNCESCLQGLNEHRILLQCAWCSTTQKCYLLSRYHLTAYPFGQCLFWVDDLKRCPRCSVHDSCTSCLETYECGWCSDATNPLLGYCTIGGFRKPKSKCNSNELALQYPNASQNKMLWTYGKCPDIDECLIQEWPVGKILHSCHTHATCHNTYGSYICICNDGYKGTGQQCERTCLAECRQGRCSGYPNFECICDLGWTSSANATLENEVECDVSCNCNFLSTCFSGQGMCDSCQRNTRGHNCEKCLPGFFHVNKTGMGCQPCQCNGHGMSSLNQCNEVTGHCFCQHKTRGKNCDICDIGYFGDPRDGGICFRKCEGRLKLEEPIGAFGSWKSSIRWYGSTLRKLKERNDSHTMSRLDCQWTIAVENYTLEDGILVITIEKNINLPCYKNNIFVYDGAVGFGETKLLGEFCGSSWGVGEALQVPSGIATIQLKNVFLEEQHQKFGFAARYEIQPYCRKIISPMDQDMPREKSDCLVADSITRVNPDANCHIEFFSGCLGNCSSDLGQGFCKKGLCYCNSNFTGFDCSLDTRKTDYPIDLQLEWIGKLSKGVNPGRRIGHVLIGVGSSIWLHAGISDGRLSDDLWRYDVSEREWTIQAVYSPHPTGRYFHAASSYANKNQFYIYGGNLLRGKSSSNLWIYSTVQGVWKEVITDTALPPLAGHTFTFCGEPVAYVIGGFNSFSGFNNIIWTYNSENQEVSFLPKSIGSLPLIFGHSTVCDRDSGILYIYGGMEASFLQFPSPTSEAYLLDTKALLWKPLNSYKSKLTNPAPRAFHSALSFITQNIRGMLVLGGRLESSQTSNEIWFLDYSCSTWKRMVSDVKELTPTLVKGIPTYASMTSDGQNYFMYGGFLNGGFPVEMIVLTHFHLQSTNIVLNQENCTDPDSNSCFMYKNCQHCLEEGSFCNWCQLNPLKGECVPSGKTCTAEHNIIVDKQECDSCFGESPVICLAQQGCSWKTFEVLDDYHGKFVRSCFCGNNSSRPTYNMTTTLSSADSAWRRSLRICENCSHKCPMSCNVHKSCTACLEFSVSSGVWWNCVWSPGLQKCMDPAEIPIACPPGGICGTLAGKGMISCPITSCEQLHTCWKCINEAHCYWIQTNTYSKCLSTSVPKYSGPFAVIYYYECPPENECIIDLDDCLEDNIHHEKCRDLIQGYECICENGFNRNTSSQLCLPVCTQGCINGKCIMPNICKCNFGYTGNNCNTPCQCNGHSDCQDASNVDVCLECHNNTIGKQCESCEVGYAGYPPKNISCRKCMDICNGKTDVCLSKSKSTSQHGPTPHDVICIDCQGHSHGDLCERCKEGYFKLNGVCRKCECNGHSDTCDVDTGGFCKCQNQTTSSDDRCFGPKNGDDPYPNDCWKKQCDKCEASYQGDPKHGGLCYRYVTVGDSVCFSAQTPSHCPSHDFSASASHFLHHTLPAGQTITFALNPKYTNVDIRITVDVSSGMLSLFLSDQPDSFRIIKDILSYSHTVVPNLNFTNDNNCSMILSQQEGSLLRPNRAIRRSHGTDYGVEAEEESTTAQRFLLKVVNASNFTSYMTLLPYTALRIDDIQNRLVVTIPHTGFDLKLKKFYVILLGHQILEPSSNGGHQKSKRSVGMEDQLISMAAGQLFFRQDETRIDLFVFFSVFFSCFFLFLAICIVSWKIKQFLRNREEQGIHDIVMEQMASRPFARVCIMLDCLLPESFFNKGKKVSFIQSAIEDDSVTKPSQTWLCPIFPNDEVGTSSPSVSRLNSCSSLSNSRCHMELAKVDWIHLTEQKATRLPLNSCFSKDEPATPVRSESRGMKYSCDSRNEMLVAHENADVQAARVPLFNSTTTYIKQESETDVLGHLPPLSVCKSKTLEHENCFSSGKLVAVGGNGRGNTNTLVVSKTVAQMANRNEGMPDGTLKSTADFAVLNLLDARPFTGSVILTSKTLEQNKSSAMSSILLKNLPFTRSGGRTTLQIQSPAVNAEWKVMKTPLSCETTEDGLASVNTVLIQQPSGSKAPLLLCLGSALIASNLHGSALRDSNECKQLFKFKKCNRP